MEENKSKKKGGLTALVIVLVLVIAALVVAVVMLINRQSDGDVQAGSAGSISSSDSAEPEKRNVVINEENIDELIEEMAEEDFVTAGNYEVTMNTEWYFEAGNVASSNAYVENSVANTNDVYFDVILADSEEVIYKSPLLPIGSHIESITLDKDLDAGLYNCIVVYNLVDENQKVLSQLQVGATVNVEN